MTHTAETIAALETMLLDSEREYIAAHPGVVGTLERERAYVAGHWQWGTLDAETREQMAFDNYGGRLAAFLDGTLGLRD